MLILKQQESIPPVFSKKDIEFIGTFEPDSLPLGLNASPGIYYSMSS